MSNLKATLQTSLLLLPHCCCLKMAIQKMPPTCWVGPSSPVSDPRLDVQQKRGLVWPPASTLVVSPALCLDWTLSPSHQAFALPEFIA